MPLSRFLNRERRGIETSVEQAGEAEIIQRLLGILGGEELMRTRITDAEHDATKDGVEAFALVLPAGPSWIATSMSGSSIRKGERIALNGASALEEPVMRLEPLGLASGDDAGNEPQCTSHGDYRGVIRAGLCCQLLCEAEGQVFRVVGPARGEHRTGDLVAGQPASSAGLGAHCAGGGTVGGDHGQVAGAQFGQELGCDNENGNVAQGRLNGGPATARPPHGVGVFQ